MRRFGILLLALTLIDCSSADKPESNSGGVTDTHGSTESKNYRVLATGQYGAAAQRDSVGRRAPFVLVARDVNEFERLWRENIGSTPLPEIDFSKERAVFLLLGPQSTGGYSIELHDVDRDGERLQIDATLHHPSEGAITTQAISAPYAVIAVRDREFRSVEWESGRRLLARTDLAN